MESNDFRSLIFEWFLKEAPVLLAGVVFTLGGQWLWERLYVNKYTLKAEAEQQEKGFLQLVRKVMDEIDSNCKSGVGDKDCPFVLEAHASLAESTNQRLPQETKDSIRRILYEGRLCNANRFQNGATPNHVKEMSRLLKDQLKQLLPAEINLCK